MAKGVQTPSTQAPESLHPGMTENNQRDVQYKRDHRFWMICVCITASQFITALEMTAVSTALPTIVEVLHGEQFVWIGSGYQIATTAFIPLSGNLAQIFGRRVTMLGSILIFALGSALCGAATSMNFLIGGRVVQGLGSGGIQALCQIIVSDIIPLNERGVFNGLLAMSFVVANGIGPVVGGALAQHGQWRWLFYLNLPVCGVIGFLVLIFLRLRTPSDTMAEKLSRIDWIGNILVVAACTALMIALTWGGVQYAWSSWHILVPLILGVVGLIGFMVYEAMIPKEPIVPYILLTSRTATSGYLQSVMNNTVITAMVYYLPVYFQACLDASPVASGVDMFGLAFSVAPMAVFMGLSIAILKKYRPQMWASWCLLILGMGLLTMVKVDTPRGRTIGFEIIAGAGTGMVAAGVSFPILAPVSVEHNAQALALYSFVRNLANVLGPTIGGTVLQNELQKKLPLAFQQQFPANAAIAYSVIPLIKMLEQPLKGEVQTAFAGATQVVWQVMTGIAGLGLLFSLLMEHVPLHNKVDEKWGLEEQPGGAGMGAEREAHQIEAHKAIDITGVDSSSTSRLAL